MNYTLHTNCRVCGNDNLIQYIDLGMLPLSNNLCSSPIEMAEKYPLQVALCSECGLSQLTIVVNPELLFSHYVYRSSISKGYVDHCRQMAYDLQMEYGLNKDSFHIDIAGNDGALLQQFQEVIGCNILNVDPAKNLSGICIAKKIPTLTYFWSLETANRIINSWGIGSADLITATNVFAHVDNVHDFMQGVKVALKPTGVLIMEFPYLIDFIDNNEFDTIYFEHNSYFSISPLALLCTKVGLKIMKVEKQTIHGGTVRVHIGYGESDPSVYKYLQKEIPYKNIRPYRIFAEVTKRTVAEFYNGISKLKNVAGFAASAKGNTLLNCAGITLGGLRYIVDETPEKIGKFSPGTHIPIVSMLELQSNPPDYLVILSWNFAEEIIAKCRKSGYAGKFIIPIPKFKIINNEKGFDFGAVL